MVPVVEFKEAEIFEIWLAEGKTLSLSCMLSFAHDVHVYSLTVVLV